MLKELEEFIQNNQDDIIVTGGITDEKINDLEESLGLEFRKEIREYLHQYGIIIGYGVEILGCGKNGESSLVKETERFRKLGLSDEYIVIRNSDEWIYCFNNNDGIINSRGSGNYSSDEAKEIARLKKELKDTQDALEVLKKAIGILGK